MEGRDSNHKRSLSYLVKRDKLNKVFKSSRSIKPKEMGQLDSCIEAKKRRTHTVEVQSSLEHEIVELQETLQDQYVVRRAFEKALSYRPVLFDTVTDKSIPKDAKELIKEIAVLELEVANLEKYLLSLYRETFDRRCNFQTETLAPERKFSEVSISDYFPQKENTVVETSISGNAMKEISNVVQEPEKVLDSSIHRSHSSLSQRSFRASPRLKSVAKAVDSFHSLPLSMLEQAEPGSSSGVSLAEHFSTCVSDHTPETANWLSEEMIKCISDIYCELADPPLMNQNFPFSPISYSSPLDVVSSQGHSDSWSPQCGKFSSFNSHFDNPFSIGESSEFSGPYCTMAKVEKICRDDEKLKDVEHKLQYYRSLVYRLEGADPKRMKHEEKLAFWINVHNALVMHAFLVYGVPNNNLKRVSLLLKAAYNVGGQTVNVDMIQCSILRCRMPRPGQWLRFLFSAKTKFKTGDSRKEYTIDHPEPRLHFALCSGSYSDPVVRKYTPKSVFQDLETAKEEYIQSNIAINKDQKILLPKTVESFAKDSDICLAGLLETIEHFMPSSLRKNIQQKKPAKTIEWTPHNFTFRYLLSKELA